MSVGATLNNFLSQFSWSSSDNEILSVVWSSSDPSVASVEDLSNSNVIMCRVTGLSPGTATITADIMINAWTNVGFHIMPTTISFQTVVS